MTGDETLTARMDNAGLDPALVTTARAVMGTTIKSWENAGPKEQVLLGAREDLRDLGDHVFAVAHEGKSSYWILQNDWSGFPDPSEFVLVGFKDQGEVFALGYFEDWPLYWTRPEG
ncbi:MAG: hypothetical protein GY945_06765 [Rhodobacteraceae bacterium]|nr:hypothetical protein [Paracoccaceae bacterium]